VWKSQLDLLQGKFDKKFTCKFLYSLNFYSSYALYIHNIYHRLKKILIYSSDIVAILMFTIYCNICIYIYIYLI